MKSLLFVFCSFLLGMGLIWTMPSFASDHEKKSKKGSSQTQTENKNGDHQKKELSLKQRSKVTNNIPVYKPPLRGAPAGRVAGGTRGEGQDLPYLCLIVPEHIGLTISRQPVLYYYQSKTSPYPIEFTLIQKQGISPIVEKSIGIQDKPGIHPVRLADFGIRLEPGIHYKWFIALIPDSQHRSKDILAAGGMEFIEPSKKIKTQLASAERSQAVYVYADAGIWYDAFFSLSSLIEKSPDDAGLRKQRASLLQQIGLIQAAYYDMGK